KIDRTRRTNMDQHHLAEPAIDPVCGMTVQPDQAAGKSEYRGQTFYFCNPSCLRQFQANPQRYLNPRGESALTRIDTGKRSAGSSLRLQARPCCGAVGRFLSEASNPLEIATSICSR